MCGAAGKAGCSASGTGRVGPRLVVYVQTCGTALQYASEALKNDKEVVFAAVQQDGRALQYASEELQISYTSSL